MSDMSRRAFLELSARLAVLMGLGASAIPTIAEAVEELTSRSVRVLWLQGLSCSGCSVSLLNSDSPGPLKILTEYTSMLFHSTLSAATGAQGMDVINKSIDQGEYYLVVEGSIPQGMPHACRMGDGFVTDQILRASRAAKMVIAAGTCASFGGVAAAENNPTGAVSVPRFLKDKGVSAPVINVPGCPVHPDWLMGALVHLLKFGIPPLDEKGRPKMFFSKLIHDQCPRFADYERERFAGTFSEEGCLFKLGCLGPITHADCSLRLWNSGTSFCIKSGSPCIGCAAENFLLSGSLPLFTKKPAAEKKKG
jgi:hydrogenase small subunit